MVLRAAVLVTVKLGRFWLAMSPGHAVHGFDFRM
jgi:hypothetical protein